MACYGASFSFGLTRSKALAPLATLAGMHHERQDGSGYYRPAKAAMIPTGGRVLAVGDPAHPVLQALVRWDPAGFAERETSERLAAHLPPASRLATLSGEPGAVEVLR